MVRLGLFLLCGWIVAGRFPLALFVVADSVTSLLCVCKGFRKAQQEHHMQAEVIYDLESEYVQVYTPHFHARKSTNNCGALCSRLCGLYFVIKLALALFATFRCLMIIASIRFCCIVAEDVALVLKL